RIERPSHTLFVHVAPELCAERLAQRAGAPAWKWERLETQKRVAALFEVVLDDPATRPLYGRLERIANEGSLPDFEARIEAFAAGLIAREPEPRSGGSVCDASAPGSRSPRACTCTATSWLRIASAGAGPI